MEKMYVKKTGKEIINFPDANFKKYLVENFDADGDGEISVEEALPVTEMILTGTYNPEKSNYDGFNVSLLGGIEYFSNLTRLDCRFNPLTSIDVSKNKQITHLSCDAIYILTKLDISGCNELQYLNCNKTNISELDISNNTNLTVLSCGNCDLSTLDVRNNTALTYLSCRHNQLTAIDVSQNTQLKYLSVRHNDLTELDISHNLLLENIQYQDTEITSLDKSHNPKLV